MYDHMYMNARSADHKDGSVYAHSGDDADDDNCADVCTMMVGLVPTMCNCSSSKRPYGMHM